MHAAGGASGNAPCSRAGGPSACSSLILPALLSPTVLLVPPLPFPPPAIPASPACHSVSPQLEKASPDHLQLDPSQMRQRLESSLALTARPQVAVAYTYLLMPLCHASVSAQTQPCTWGAGLGELTCALFCVAPQAELPKIAQKSPSLLRFAEEDAKHPG